MHEHRRDQKAEAVVALMITSDTRTPENDETGKTGIQLLEGAGHHVAVYVIVENDTTKIEETFKRIGVLKSKTGGMNDLVVDFDTVLKWSANKKRYSAVKR